MDYEIKMKLGIIFNMKIPSFRKQQLAFIEFDPSEQDMLSSFYVL